MSDYKLKDKGINSGTEKTSAISTISYEVENALYNGLTINNINDQILDLKNSGKFPPNLQLVDAFYDKNTSLSGVAFKDNNTGKVTVGFAGTNLDNGWGEKMQDFIADGSIAVNGDTARSAYFKEGNAFLNNLKQNYTVDTVTGHSKGGRDGAVLGMSHQIPNIVLYNAAPLSNKLGKGIGMLFDQSGFLNRIFSEAEMAYIIHKYKGRLVYFISEDDPLNKYASMFGSLYPGEKFKLYNGKGHDMTGFLSKEEQAFIRAYLPLVDENGKKISSVEIAKTMTKMRMKELNSLRNKLTKSGGGLSSTESIFLDAAEALAITEGMKQTIQAELLELKTMYNNAIEDAQQLWADTLANASTVGATLTEAEELSALQSGGATKESIVTEPVAEYERALAKAAEIEQHYDQLIDSIKASITEQLAADHGLASQIGSA
ncbi:hypothetical protein [Enterococcus sp. LJL51]|uniref:hypothetical protein n=1 Tax=Enterococcus sp. LJL51 TaxID=3416656 RepID=UPI003CEE894E